MRMQSSTRLHRCFSNFVKIVEVGPRDGLQNESVVIETSDKVEFINLLSKSGLPSIEVTSFVSPKWVPQMADSIEVASSITRNPKVAYSAIVPNSKGLQMAKKANITNFAVGTAASETFCKRNWNCSISETLERSSELIKTIKTAYPQAHVRGYVSNVMGCPYEGDIKLSTVIDLSEKLVKIGCDEISLGDTTGVGTPLKFENMIKEIVKVVPVDKVAVHCHDTYGQALPNILKSLEHGVSIVDSSTGGLGGCPYAPGASGTMMALYYWSNELSSNFRSPTFQEHQFRFC